MRKILLILTTTLFILLIAPQKVIAGCNPLDFDQSREYTVTGWSPVSLQDAIKDAKCPAGVCPNSSGGYFIPGGWQGFSKCWPPGRTTTNPTCPSSAPLSPWACPSLCCVPDLSALSVPGTCQYKPGVPVGIVDCNYIRQWAVGAVTPQNCPDPTTKLEGGKCVKVSTSIGDLKYDCGSPIKAADGSTKMSGITTAIGCIEVNDLTKFMAFVLKFVFGLSGGLILIMLIITSYNILTSAGDPEKVQASKENLVSILSGLILIAFSLVLLQTIGVSILKLPGF